MSAYTDLCKAMHEKGWLSHPLAAMKLGWPHRGQHLSGALKSTRTYGAYDLGEAPPAFDEQAATPATLTYQDRNGVIVDQVFLDPSRGLVLHVHSINGDKTIAFLDDVPPQYLTSSSLAHGAPQTEPQPTQALNSLSEGGQRSVTLTIYERNSVARRRCIQHYGTSCAICGFSFGNTYGESFSDYIHVHHLTPVSVRDGKHDIDPVQELRPVCPNCHAVIHSKQPPLTISEVQQMLSRTVDNV